jgi:hypothetical protein
MSNLPESPSRIEPCLLDEIPVEIADLVADLSAASQRLGHRLHRRTAQNLADLVRIMNCYYSNFIEGHNTEPRDIERALADDLDREEGRRNLQLAARAHIRVQREIDRLYAEDSSPGRLKRYVERLQLKPEAFYILERVLLQGGDAPWGGGSGHGAQRAKRTHVARQSDRLRHSRFRHAQGSGFFALSQRCSGSLIPALVLRRVILMQSSDRPGVRSEGIAGDIPATIDGKGLHRSAQAADVELVQVSSRAFSDHMVAFWRWSRVVEGEWRPRLQPVGTSLCHGLRRLKPRPPLWIVWGVAGATIDARIGATRSPHEQGRARSQEARRLRRGDRHQECLQCQHEPRPPLLAVVGGWEQELEWRRESG